MIKKPSRLFIPAVLLLLLFLAACSKDPEANLERSGRRGANALGNRGNSDQAMPVQVSLPARADLSSYVFGNSHIESRQEVEIVARVEGQLKYLVVEEGDRVRSGQVLARLDTTELALARDEARVRVENAHTIYDRAQQMLEKELVSQEQLENSKYQYETAKTQLERAELSLRYATITAPFNGIITRRLIEPGQMIRPSMALFNLADMDNLLTRVYVPEKELARIYLGSPVRLASQIFPEDSFSGEVEMIAPVVDAATGTVKVTVRVTHGRDKLKPGMFCSVYILCETHQDALVIDRKALLPEVDEPQVFVVDSSGAVRLRPIVTGIVQGDTVEVISGLEEGERVVVIGQETLRDGVPVLIAGQERKEAESAGENPVPRRNSGARSGPRQRGASNGTRP